MKHCGNERTLFDVVSQQISLPRGKQVLLFWSEPHHITTPGIGPLYPIVVLGGGFPIVYVVHANTIDGEGH